MKKYVLSVAMAALLWPAVPLQAGTPYRIYPVPQQMTELAGTVNLGQAVCLVCEDGIDQATRQRARQVLEEHGLTVTEASAPSATQANVLLGIQTSGGAADQAATALNLSREVFAVEGKYDRHILSLRADGVNGQPAVVIVGQHTDAAFYALASLEQMLDAGHEAMPCTDIADYADQQNRGIVEGYYGYPYSVEVKKDLMRFMMRHKMNTYLYGAKSDPYHSQYWKDAYPTTVTQEQEGNGWLSQDMVRDIAATSSATKVNFIWAIHPGNDFIYSSTVINDIMGKFDKMHELGVRQFAVFVDDVGVPSSDADLQKNADNLTALQRALEEKYNQPGAVATDTVKPLHFVPQIYCTAFASSTDQYNRFFQALATTPKYISIYTTGYGVWSVPNSNDLATPKAQLGRDVAWWWNYPCNDNADAQIFPMDMYTNFYDMPQVNGQAKLPSQLVGGIGIVSNPMQQGEVAKTPIFSVADYAWNNSGFDNKASWQASFQAVLPHNAQAAEAYQAIAPYLTYNDPDSFGTLISQYKKNKETTELMAALNNIVANAEVLIALKDSEVESDRLLYKDLKPWLLKLHAMASVTANYLSGSVDEGSSDEDIWDNYLQSLRATLNLDSEEDFKAYALEGMGNAISVSVRTSQPAARYLLPFINYLKENSLKDWIQQETPPTRDTYFTNKEGLRGTVSTSQDIVGIANSGFTLEPHQYLGIMLKEPAMGTTITLADTLLQKYHVVMSPDGKQWTRLTETVTTPAGYLRYVAVVNDSEQPITMKLVRKSIAISVIPKTVVSSTTIPEGNVWDNHTAQYMVDGDYNTFVCLNRNQANNDAYVVDLGKEIEIKNVRIAMGTVNGDYMNEGRVQVSTDGTKWYNLPVKGSSTTAFTMSLPQVKDYSDEAKLCDFNGQSQKARYVRLLLTKANTAKWLRLYEIEVNGPGTTTQLRCQDQLPVSLTQAIDGLPYTSTAKAVGNEILYRFQQVKLLKNVILYCDASTATHAVVQLSRDGEVWTEGQPITSNLFHLDCSAMPDATQLRISWTEGSAPAIYEIVEQADEENPVVVTRIDALLANGDANGMPSLVFANGNLRASMSGSGISSIALYDTAGQLLASTRRTQPAAEVSLPLASAATGTVIAVVTDGLGQKHSFKVVVAH